MAVDHSLPVLIVDDYNTMVRIIRNLLKQLGGMGKTIMVSSHILQELADVCNKIGIIEKGVLLENDEVAEVMRKVRGPMVLLIGIKGGPDGAAKLIEQHSSVASVVPHEGALRVTLTPGDHDPSELAKLLVDNGHALTRLAEEEINLETAFMKLTQGITS